MPDPQKALPQRLGRNLRTSGLLCALGLLLGLALVWNARSANVRAWGYVALGGWVISGAFLAFSAMGYRRLMRPRAQRP